MNHYRTFHSKLTDVYFSMLEFKLRNNTIASYQAMEALTEAIKEADQLAGIMEMSDYKAREAFESSKFSKIIRTRDDLDALPYLTNK